MAKKILIIDDDPEILSYMEDLLKEEGYRTFTAKDGVEGISMAQMHNPDLITLDMDMPGRGGTMFYVKLRQEPSLADIPVIVISGVGPRPPAISKSVPVVSKPVESVKVLRLIKEMLGESVTE
ncbi:response regulator [Oceanidesulfovibrio indonesiensis]|uniref:Response regulator n=1 Tax=Oceanidesulfovibrio indonesiensis TaxID=54767 RepID=A0A7M3MCZ7_9BACT|nr:response regulator [Oceanidesulfovibrio indonesiensis]TVM16392.1 response regulator [Oceanidesulfovibrio indonesiensis]